MKDQVEEAISMFGETIDGTVSSPHTKKLFDLTPAEELDSHKSEIFHSVVAKLLFIMKRSNPDIETAVSFLMTRVSKSDVEDWKKLKRVLTFLQQHIDEPRYIGAFDLERLFTWIDAAYGVHHDFRGHTGGCMSFGIGMIHCKASRQKLNTKSSTETEVVGFSDYVPYNIWIRNFLAYQGYPLKSNIVFQDNCSAILMEKNGRNSCTGNSRHIDIRYFFVTDRIAKGEFSVSHCPTLLMIADFFTKPLQGSLFKKFRDIIMGYVPILLPPVLNTLNCSSSQERLGNPKMDSCLKDLNPNKRSENKITDKSVSFLPDTNLSSNPIPRMKSKLVSSDTTYANVLRGSKRK